MLDPQGAIGRAFPGYEFRPPQLAMLETVADLNANLLKDKGLKLIRTADDVVYVTDAVEVVQRNLAIGAALAILVLFLFLRSGPATLIGAIGIPICTIAAFIGLLAAGRTINVISLAGVAFAIAMGGPGAVLWMVLAGILGFVASFAMSLGPVMWVLFSEIFPNRVRGVAVGITVVFNSVSSFAVQFLFPWELANLGNAMTFYIFAALGVVGVILIQWLLPETKGKTLEELETVLAR